MVGQEFFSRKGTLPSRRFNSGHSPALARRVNSVSEKGPPAKFASPNYSSPANHNPPNRLCIWLSGTRGEKNLEVVGIEQKNALKRRKLLILQGRKAGKNLKNGRLRYTGGTQK